MNIRKFGITSIFFVAIALTGSLAVFLFFQSWDRASSTSGENVKTLSHTEANVVTAITTRSIPNTLKDNISEDKWNAFVRRIEKKYPIVVEGDKYSFKSGAFPAFEHEGGAKSRDWYKQWGHFEYSDIQQYEGFDIPSLETLVDQGDVLAMHVLSTRRRNIIYDYSASVEDMKQAKEESRRLLELASVHGSTGAMLELAALYSSRDDAIESEALYRAAASLGDKSAKNILYAIEVSPRFELSDDDRELIEARTNDILRDLQQKRAELNLGDRVEKPDYVIEYEEQLSEANAMMDSIHYEFVAAFGSDEESSESVANGG